MRKLNIYVVLLVYFCTLTIGAFLLRGDRSKTEKDALERGYDIGYAQGKIDKEAEYTTEDKSKLCIDWYFTTTSMASDLKRVCARKDWLD